jgi:hypothetical protein
MGYLNNSTITIDAILTKKGRELLARGRDEFKITQFALADDEIDYDLYNPDHPLGSSYYGAAIENMPIVEALPDETQMMKYKLVTLPKGTANIPVVSIGQSSVSLENNQSYVIRPQTVNFQGGNRTFGYTAILSDSDAGTLIATLAAPNVSAAAGSPQFIGDSEAAQSVTVTGLEFEFVAKPQLLSNKTATILIIGNETGGRATLNVTVNRVQVPTVAPTAATR